MPAEKTLLPCEDDLHEPVLSMADVEFVCAELFHRPTFRRAIEAGFLFPIPQAEARKLPREGRGAPAYLVFSLYEAAIAAIGAVIHRDTGRELAEALYMARLLSDVPDHGDYIERLFRQPPTAANQARQHALFVFQYNASGQVYNAEGELEPDPDPLHIGVTLLYPKELAAMLIKGGLNAHVMDVEYYASRAMTLLVHKARSNRARLGNKEDAQ